MKKRTCKPLISRLIFGSEKMIRLSNTLQWAKNLKKTKTLKILRKMFLQNNNYNKLLTNR